MGPLLRLLSLLGLNAVPAVGIFFGGGWSNSTALVLYRWENFFGSLLIAIRIVAHRRLTRKRGHDAAHIVLETDTNSGIRATPRGSFLADFRGNMLIFTSAHGIFLAIILVAVLPERQTTGTALHGDELREGLVGMTGFLLAGLGVDLVGLKVLLDLAWRLPQREHRVPDAPPRWARRFASRVVGHDDAFVKAWRAESQRERDEEKEDELPLDDASVMPDK